MGRPTYTRSQRAGPSRNRTGVPCSSTLQQKRPTTNAPLLPPKFIKSPRSCQTGRRKNFWNFGFGGWGTADAGALDMVIYPQYGGCAAKQPTPESRHAILERRSPAAATTRGVYSAPDASLNGMSFVPGLTSAVRIVSALYRAGRLSPGNSSRAVVMLTLCSPTLAPRISRI